MQPNLRQIRVYTRVALRNYDKLHQRGETEIFLYECRLWEHNEADFLNFIETPGEKYFSVSLARARCINSLLMREFSPRDKENISLARVDFADVEISK